MKRLISLTFLLFMLSLLPGRGVSAEDPQLPYRLSLPIVSRMISLSVTHISPNIGRTLGVIQDPFNAHILYTYTFGAGIYKSTDSGATWFPSSNGLGYLVIQSMVADPVNPGVLYAGTYGDTYAAYNGVYKSVDFGASWTQTGEMGNTWNGAYYKNPVVYVVAIDPANPNIVFAGTRMKIPSGQLGGGGVFRSDNGGASWTPVNNGLPYDKLYVYDLILNPSKPGQVYVTLHGIPPGGIYISNNYGDTWTPFWTPVSSPALDGRALLLDPFDSSILIYGAATNAGIFRFRANQENAWRSVAEGMNVNVRALSADPYHPGRMFAGVCIVMEENKGCYYRLMRSNDGGGQWTEFDAGNSSYPLAFSPNQQTVYMAIDFNGIARSDDEGLSWYSSSSGLTGYSATGLAVAHNDPNFLAAALYGEGVKISSNGGASWDNRSYGLPTTGLTFLAMDPGNPQVMYVTTDQSGVYRTDNGAGNWTLFGEDYPAAAAGLSSMEEEPVSAYTNRPIPEPDDDVHPTETQPENSIQELYGRTAGTTLAVSPVDGRVVLVGTSGRGIYALVNNNWVPTGLSSGGVYSLWFDKAVGGRVLAGVDAGLGGVLVSANNGQTWAASNSGMSGRKVYSLAQSPATPTIFLAGTDSGVYASGDGGVTWSLAGLEGQAVKCVAVYNSELGKYLAATANAVYASPTLPGAWITVSKDLNDMGTQYLLTAPTGDSFYVLSRLGGIKRVK